MVRGPSEPKMRCPRCKGSCSVERAKNISPLCREIYYRYRDLNCGVTFVAQLEPVRIIRGPADLKDIGLPIVSPGDDVERKAAA